MVTRREPFGGIEIVSCQNAERVEGADTHVVDSGGFRLEFSHSPEASKAA